MALAERKRKSAWLLLSFNVTDVRHLMGGTPCAADLCTLAPRFLKLLGAGMAPGATNGFIATVAVLPVSA
jgi:hypothetical protein